MMSHWNSSKKLLFFSYDDFKSQHDDDDCVTSDTSQPVSNIARQSRVSLSSSTLSTFASDRSRHIPMAGTQPVQTCATGIPTSVTTEHHSTYSGAHLDQMRAGSAGGRPSPVSDASSSSSIVHTYSHPRSQTKSSTDSHLLSSSPTVAASPFFVDVSSSDMQQHQIGFLGARPKTVTGAQRSATPQPRRLDYDDTVPRDIQDKELQNLENLCRLMTMTTAATVPPFSPSTVKTRPFITPAVHSPTWTTLPKLPKVLVSTTAANTPQPFQAKPFQVLYEGLPKTLPPESPCCNFCKRNGETRAVYRSHKLMEHGVTVCPILKKYVCPICGATGGNAHTVSYCPSGRGNIESIVSATRTPKKSCGCARSCKHGRMKHH